MIHPSKLADFFTGEATRQRKQYKLKYVDISSRRYTHIFTRSNIFGAKSENTVYLLFNLQVAK